MARQNQTPVNFQRSTRTDTATLMTSGRAGKTIMLGYVPILRGDSAAGRVGFDLELGHMPKPLLNQVVANFQAWFVPKNAHPQFAGTDEFLHSYTGEPIKALGVADRDPPTFFQEVSDPTDLALVDGSEMFTTLGSHDGVSKLNTDLIDAFWLVYNFRLAAHSSKLDLHPYGSEDLAAATQFPRALWPMGRNSRIVPDYEKALIVGELDLDVSAGIIPVEGLWRGPNDPPVSGTLYGVNDGSEPHPTLPHGVFVDTDKSQPRVFGQMMGSTVVSSLADIDKARQTQAFAQLRTTYAGNDTTGYQNDDTIVASLMQGLSVPADQFRRPWLLDSKRVPVGFAQRYATDAANLDQSVSQGVASATLSINIPQQDSGGIVIYTVELLPERIYERQQDDWVHCTQVNELPDALRDIQRTEPVDFVPHSRIDMRHTDPDGLYGFEGMNDKWNRDFTRMGGIFYQATPGDPFKEARSALWTPEIVDPIYSEDQFLAPADFPHDVFSDTTAPAFEVVCRHTVSIVGLTQIGDVLSEDNNEYDDTKNAGDMPA